MPRKPHVAIHVERNADGSTWSQWRCDGQGLHAFGYTPREAFTAWRLRADAQDAATVAAEPARQRAEKHQQERVLH